MCRRATEPVSTGREFGLTSARTGRGSPAGVFSVSTEVAEGRRVGEAAVAWVLRMFLLDFRGVGVRAASVAAGKSGGALFVFQLMVER